MNKNGVPTTASEPLKEMAQKIRSRDDLVAFVATLAHDITHNPDEWENSKLSDYLEAVSAWVNDMDGFFENRKLDVPEHPSWQLLGEILLAAKSYE